MHIYPKHLHKWVRLRTAVNLLAAIGLFYLVAMGVKYGVAFLQEVRQEITGVPLYHFEYIGTFTVTSYSDRREETDSTPNITSVGERVRYNTIAVSQDLLRSKRLFYGDILWVDELKEFRVVADTMNSRWTNRVDVFYFDRNKVDNFGLKRCHIYRVR